MNPPNGGRDSDMNPDAFFSQVRLEQEISGCDERIKNLEMRISPCFGILSKSPVEESDDKSIEQLEQNVKSLEQQLAKHDQRIEYLTS